MKPFDIEKAKVGAPVCTRDGRPAKIVCYNYKHSCGDYPILAIVTDLKTHYDTTIVCAASGRCYLTSESAEDLMMAEKPVYRPYNDVSELIAAIKEKGLVVADTEHEVWYVIASFTDGEVWLPWEEDGEERSFSYTEMLEKFCWADKTPFGVKVED